MQRLQAAEAQCVELSQVIHFFLTISKKIIDNNLNLSNQLLSSDYSILCSIISILSTERCFWNLIIEYLINDNIILNE